MDCCVYIAAAERYQDGAYWINATPKGAGKGSAVSYLRERLGLVGAENIVCVGDSGNDVSMMSIDGVKGVVVANASPDLMEFYEENKDNGRIIKTKNPCTLGVIEALELHGPQFVKQSKL